MENLEVVLNWFEELKARVGGNSAPLAEQLAGGARMWWASLRLS